MKPDDASVSSEQLHQIRQHALKALQKANAQGRFPTPVNDVMEAAKIVIAEEDTLSESFLNKIRNKTLRFGKTLKSALSKVLGIFETAARIVHIDRTLLEVRKVFLKLHETAHGVLVWQKDIYCAIEDCEKTLSPEISEAFDREANAFASEVLFQLNTFQEEAADSKFGIAVPLQLKKKYGASIYSTVRRYVSTHHRSCIVLVLDMPVLVKGDGFTATLRRVISSPSFEKYFGQICWPNVFTPDDEIGKIVPLGKRRMSRPAQLVLGDQNGVQHECIAEAFCNTYQVFILIHEVKALTRTAVIIQ
jgi:Zn-dependent peptidase ImmA (M78 family)